MTAGTPSPDGRNILISHIAIIRIFLFEYYPQLGRLAAALCRFAPGRYPNLYLAEYPAAHARSPCKIRSSIRTVFKFPPLLESSGMRSARRRTIFDGLVARRLQRWRGRGGGEAVEEQTATGKYYPILRNVPNHHSLPEKLRFLMYHPNMRGCLCIVTIN